MDLSSAAVRRRGDRPGGPGERKTEGDSDQHQPELLQRPGVRDNLLPILWVCGRVLREDLEGQLGLGVD